jgi:hypothetical protein
VGLGVGRQASGVSPDEKIFTTTDERGFLPYTPHPTPYTLFPVRRIIFIYSPFSPSYSAITTGSQKYVGLISYFVLFVKKTFFLQ